MSVNIERIVAGPIDTNAWIVYNDDKKCFIVDPSSGCEEILGFIKEKNLNPESIIITHSHFDHILGIPEIIKCYPDLKLYVHPKEALLLKRSDLNGSYMIGMDFTYDKPVIDLTEGPMTIGSFPLTVLVVPGHSPAGCAVLIDKYCICGDILFAGSIGRSDLPGGNGELLVKGIREKMLVLPDDTVVCSGHGGRTTIGREKKENPFL
jgi:glyoxylase-like metal-dependent hydrolase (beta-lactamase superfamily II)